MDVADEVEVACHGCCIRRREVSAPGGRQRGEGAAVAHAGAEAMYNCFSVSLMPPPSPRLSASGAFASKISRCPAVVTGVVPMSKISRCPKMGVDSERTAGYHDTPDPNTYSTASCAATHASSCSAAAVSFSASNSSSWRPTKPRVPI